jgi:DNA-binding NarL/FixJ family response regulator
MIEDDPEISVVGEASDGKQGVELAQQLKPRVIVMDFAMPNMDGVQATREILRHLPKTAILILSMYSEENYVRNAFDAGALGYILKNAMDIDLPAAIKDAAAGKRVVDPGLLSAERGPDDMFDKLTPREKQVLQLVAEGNSNREIAAMLNISSNTVAVHRANLIKALGVHRTADLVVYAIRKGLITP